MFFANFASGNPKALKRAQIAEKRKDYAKAALEYFKVTKSPQAKSRVKKIAMVRRAEIGLAKNLFKMELYYSSSLYLTRIVRRGPGKSNKYFKQAFDTLGRLNGLVNLGREQVVALFKAKIKPSQVPGEARGFYFYYRGMEAFADAKFKIARSNFKRVQPDSLYYLKSIFHLAVIATLTKESKRAIKIFLNVIELSVDEENSLWIKELAHLNLARIYYEKKDFRNAIRYYAKIPRESDNWLQALFESSWAFYLMEKPNNTLGNIHTLHSPFFETRFFPESYIIQAITYLKMCRYEKTKNSIKSFKNRYTPVLKDIKALLKANRMKKNQMFKAIYEYRTRRLQSYRYAWPILDALSRADSYKQAGLIISTSDQEISLLESSPRSWDDIGLTKKLNSFLKKKKKAAVKGAGSLLYDQAITFYDYLRELSSQTQLIGAELLLGKVDNLRKKLKVESSKKKDRFIGGLQPLDINQKLEYWPFEGEYWEDELGGYVYNIESKCRK